MCHRVLGEGNVGGCGREEPFCGALGRGVGHPGVRLRIRCNPSSDIRRAPPNSSLLAHTRPLADCSMYSSRV